MQAVRAIAKSASRTARRGKIVIQTYRGYGSARHVFLMGRVLREPSAPPPDGQGLWTNLRILWRRTRAWGVEGATLSARFGTIETTTQTDCDGYFRLELPLAEPPPADRLWHQVAIRLADPVAIDVEGDVFVPRAESGFAVISDIDDTVLLTGVANKAVMIWRTLVQGAESRTAFPGMAAFLRALHRGPRSEAANPMLYVSRAPWAIYGVLDRFFNFQEIPVGPILFLRDWGLTLQHPWPRSGKGHKTGVIRQIIAHYSDLPFVLIGDSGQRDPEIYADIVREFPGRIQAVYIRDVSKNPSRGQVINGLARVLAESGSTLILASDTSAMAHHAAENGLIAETAFAEIDADVEAAS
ncbi:MAG: App1 family protein [Geminicoccaceae bacterium]